jgi:hypothetical protein
MLNSSNRPLAALCRWVVRGQLGSFGQSWGGPGRPQALVGPSAFPLSSRQRKKADQEIRPTGLPDGCFVRVVVRSGFGSVVHLALCFVALRGKLGSFRQEGRRSELGSFGFSAMNDGRKLKADSRCRVTVGQREWHFTCSSFDSISASTPLSSRRES